MNMTQLKGLTTNHLPGPPTLDDLCNGGATSTPTTSLSAATLTPQMREEVRYMYIHEYADGLNKLFETQWYTTHGLERLFANYELCRLFADTLELFAKSHEYELTRQMPLRECKLVFDLMKLPRQVPYANSADVELQTLLGRLTAVECLITGRTQLSSPTSIGALQTKAEPRQSMFWKHLGDAISQSTLCEAHWGLPTVPYARENSREALVRMACVLDKIEARDFLYSGALIRHVGPPLFKSRSSQPADTGTTTTLHDFWTLGEREQTVVAKKFLEDVASGNGTTQVIMRLGGAIIRSWRYWSS